MTLGLKPYIRIILRRDRIKLPLWATGITLSLIAMVPLLKQTYSDTQSLTTLFQTFGANPAGLFLTGPMDTPTFGALMTIETVLWWGLLIAFMNTFFIVRHTRQNEEIGAQELLLSGQTHRATGLVSALIVALAYNSAIAIAIGIGISAIGGIQNGGNGWLYGLAFGVFGFAWAAIASSVVQLVQSARTANSILAGLIGVSFIMRGIGDFLGTKDTTGIMQPSWVSILSPFGWLQATRSLTIPAWQPLFIPVIASTGLILLGLFLLMRRDVGAGLLPTRAGRSRASSLRRKPLGFTGYLQKNIFIGWAAGVLSMTATIGILVPSMTKVYESSDNLKAMIASMGGHGALVPAFLSAMLSIMVLMIAGYVIHGLSRLRSEEASGHAENIFATSLSRTKWFILHVVTVLAAGLVMLTATGVLLALCVNAASDFHASVSEYILAAISYFPVLLIFAGIYILLFGLVPQLTNLVTWLYFGIAVFMSWLAPLLKLNQALMNISPLSHIASAPAEDVRFAPLMIMSMLGLLLIIIGSFAWQNRNIIGK